MWVVSAPVVLVEHKRCVCWYDAGLASLGPRSPCSLGHTLVHRRGMMHRCLCVLQGLSGWGVAGPRA